MSKSRSKKRHRARRSRPVRPVGADYARRSADAVLAVDMSDLVLRDRVPQVVVGLCRAAFAQSKVVAELAVAGMLSSAAPNRRLFYEVALRLQWLSGLSHDDRRQAADVMLEKDRRDINTTLAYLGDLGHAVDFDSADMNAFQLDAPEKGKLQEQAKKLRAAVKATESEPWSIYAMWREETRYSHPSGVLAGKYAPTFDDVHMSQGEPEIIDPDFDAHRLVQLLIAMETTHLLVEEGVSLEISNRIADAFLSV